MSTIREKKKIKPWAVSFDAMQLFSSQPFLPKNLQALHHTLSENSCASMTVTEMLSHKSMISNLAHFLSVLRGSIGCFDDERSYFFFSIENMQLSHLSLNSCKDFLVSSMGWSPLVLPFLEIRHYWKVMGRGGNFTANSSSCMAFVRFHVAMLPPTVSPASSGLLGMEERGRGLVGPSGCSFQVKHQGPGWHGSTALHEDVVGRPVREAGESAGGLAHAAGHGDALGVAHRGAHRQVGELWVKVP